MADGGCGYNRRDAFCLPRDFFLLLVFGFYLSVVCVVPFCVV